MQSLSDDERHAVLGEVLTHILKVILEYVSDVPAMAARLERIEEKVDRLESDMRIVKAATTDISQQVNSHERQLNHLESVR